MHDLAISIVTGMPYSLPKVELVSLNCFSFQGLWKWYNSRVFNQRLHAWRQHFASFLIKEDSLETLIVIFENVSPKFFFFYRIRRISKFQFWQQILYFYRQPLLIFRALGRWVPLLSIAHFVLHIPRLLLISFHQGIALHDWGRCCFHPSAH